MTDLTRRSFFKMVTGAAALAALNMPSSPAYVFDALVEDPLGGWVPCDGRWLSCEKFPDLFSILGQTYGFSSPADNPMWDLFRIPDMELPWTPGMHEQHIIPMRYHIKVRKDEFCHTPVGMLARFSGSAVP